MSAGLTQQALDHIRTRLLNGELPPGTRLSHQAIAKEIGISRTPVREAISQLVSDGLIEQLPGIGTFVKILDEKELEELLELREYVESFVAAKAAEHIEASQADQLREICDQMRSMIRDIRSDGRRELNRSEIAAAYQLDRQFHEILVQAADNRWTRHVLADLQVMERVFNYKKDVERRIELKSLVRTAREHVQILRALEEGDPEEASRLIARHVRNYPIVLDEHLRYQPSRSSKRLSREELEFLRNRQEVLAS